MTNNSQDHIQNIRMPLQLERPATGVNTVDEKGIRSSLVGQMYDTPFI